MTVLPSPVTLSGDPPMRPGLVTRCIRAFRLWRERHDPASRDSLATYRLAPIGVDADDPEAELCGSCRLYPATVRGLCFTCSARRPAA